MSVTIPRPTQPWGNVVQLGNKTYSKVLHRRRLGGRLRFSDDIRTWLSSVESADQAELEDDVFNARGVYAEYRFPLGGYCLFPIGAKTLNGALVPMLGPAPTGVNLIEDDYSRTLGIKGNAVDKRIILNYNNGTYGSLGDRLGGVWLSERDTVTTNNFRVAMGTVAAGGRFFLRTSTGPGVSQGMQYSVNGFTANTFNSYVDDSLLVIGRQTSSEQFIYNNGTKQTVAAGPIDPNDFEMTLFADSAGAGHTDARIAMCTDSVYTDPAVMDTNMAAAINAIAAALA